MHTKDRGGILEGWKLSTADWDDVANKVVSSAYTRSVKNDVPTLMSGLVSMWFKIQSIATQNRAGASTQLCLTPDVVGNLVDSFPPWRTLECWTVDTIIPINHTSSSRQHVQLPVITLPGLLSGSGLCWKALQRILYTDNHSHCAFIVVQITVIVTVKKCQWVSETCIFTDMLLTCVGWGRELAWLT